MGALGGCVTCLDPLETFFRPQNHKSAPQASTDKDTDRVLVSYAVRQSQAPWAGWATGMTRAGTKTQNFESAFVSPRDHTIFRQSPERFCLTPSGLRELRTQLRNTPDSRSGGILSPAQRLGARQRSEGALKLKISNRHSFRPEIILSSGNPLNGFV